MIFNGKINPQAIDIPFNWNADYFDGTHLSEYDLATHKANSFYSIKQNETLRFGLYGQNMKFYFENSDGSFFLNGKRIDIAYEADGNTHLLTNNFNTKDFITYKEAYSDFNGKSGEQKSSISSINFGYKTIYERENINLHFQPVVSIPLGSSVFMEAKLTSDINLNGDIIFIRNGKEIERFHAPLEANVSGQINWTVK